MTAALRHSRMWLLNPGIFLSILVLASALSAPSIADAQDEPRPLEFKFRNADIEAVLQYVSRATGLVFVNEAGYRGPVDAVSATPVSKERVLDFLNTLLKPRGVTCVKVNDTVVRIVTLEAAKNAMNEIRVGADPDKVESTDRIFTQIVPLKNLRISEFDQNLRALLPASARYAKDTSNNALVLTDSGAAIKRFLEILVKLDGREFQPLKMRVVALKHAEAAEVQRALTDFLQNRGQGIQNWSQAWHSALKDGELDPQGPTTEVVRIMPDTRTNSVVLVATERNVKLLEGFVADLDREPPTRARVKSYELRGARAQEVAATLTQLFQGQGNVPRTWEWWDAKTAATVSNSAFPIRSIADPKTNSLMVTATPEQLELIDRVVKSLDFEPATRVFPISFADAKEAANLLSQMTREFSPPPSIQADPRTNTVYVSTTAPQMERVSLLVAEIDRKVEELLQTRMYTLQHADPREVATMLNGVFSATDATVTRPVKFVINERTGTLLAKAPHEYFPVIDDIVKHLDSSAPEEEEVTYVVELKSANAAAVASVLKSVAGASTVIADTPAGLRPRLIAAPVQPGNTPTDQQPGQQFGQPVIQRSGFRELGPPPEQDPPAQQPPPPSGPGRIQVQSDEESNTLVVRAKKRDLDKIKELIASLDRYRPQVLVKALIVEVTLDKDLQYGVETFWENRLRLPGGDTRGTHSITTALGLGVGGFGYLLSASEFRASLQSLAESGRLKVLATPRILATDNKSARFSVGKSVPIISGSRQTPEGSVLNTVTYADVGIILSVTARVHPDGMVEMAVRPEVSDVAVAGGVTISPGSNAPTFIRNVADTTLTVKNGQTVVLGGLIRQAEDEAQTKVPILGDLPILGGLFSRTTISRERRELMIFITPHVAMTQTELEELTQLEMMQLKLIPQREILWEVERWLDDVP